MNRDVDPDQVAQVLGELEELRDREAEPELEAVRAAILLEDSLGITLTDDDIEPRVLDDPASVARLVADRLRERS